MLCSDVLDLLVRSAVTEVPLGSAERMASETVKLVPVRATPATTATMVFLIISFPFENAESRLLTGTS